MLKLTFATFILLLFSAALAIAQVDNRTETDCNGESRSIYSVGEAGRPLIIASKGFDCSICMNHADDLINYANTNSGDVEVWAAMTFTYSNNTPTCGNLQNWQSTYNWNQNIFAFIDTDEFWLASGTPRYYVIHPQTHEVVYSGSSFGNAFNEASGLITSSAIESNSNEGGFNIWQSRSDLIFEWTGDSMGSGTLRITNILGQEVLSRKVILDKAQNLMLPLNGNTGIYIATLQTEPEAYSRKFIYQDQ